MTARSLAIRAAILVVLFVAVAWLLGQLVPGAGERLANAEPGWIVLAVVLELIAVTGVAVKWWAVFSRPPHDIGLKRSFQISWAEVGGFAVIPAGAGGPAARIWGLRSAGMSWRMIGVRSVANGVIFSAPYVTVALTLGVLVVLGAGPADAPTSIALGPVAVVGGAVAVIVALTLAVRLRWLDKPGWRRNTREVLRVAPDGVREVPGLLKRPPALLGSATFWVCDCAALWAAFHAVGEAPPLGVVLLGYMLGQLGSAVPLPGGVGGVEPVMLAVLTASGLGTAGAAAAIVCYRAVSLGVQASAGALAVGSLAGGRSAAREPG